MFQNISGSVVILAQMTYSQADSIARAFVEKGLMAQVSVDVLYEVVTVFVRERSFS